MHARKRGTCTYVGKRFPVVVPGIGRRVLGCHLVCVWDLLVVAVEKSKRSTLRATVKADKELFGCTGSMMSRSVNISKAPPLDPGPPAAGTSRD